MSARPSPAGRGPDRVDGPLKVQGRARYAAEFQPEGLCHAALVLSTLPVARITHLETEDAEQMPGVLCILTHRNAPALPQRGRAAVDPPSGREVSLLQDDRVRYNGEPIGVVVAETLEQARAAAARVRASYERLPAELEFDRAKADPAKPEKSGRSPVDKSWGDFEAADANADVRVDATYITPMEHHNAIEPHATIAHWEGDRLTLYDSTQYVSGTRQTVAKTLGIEAANVRVVCPFVGGAFGSKGSVWSHVVLAAMAARIVGRPVKLALERRQLFGPVGGRPRTEQHIVLAADPAGRLVGIRHDVLSHTSRFEEFVEPSAQPSRALYACANGTTSQRLVKLDVPTPTFQRAPGESTGTFAIESAMDELAYAVGVDPLELRLRNYAQAEPTSGKPWSSKRLRECYADAARRFGWERRSREPGTLRDGPWRIGWGMATATYPAHLEAAHADARVLADGTIRVRSGTQDLGTGTYTVMTQVAADALGVPMDLVRFELGDTRLPQAGISGGSMTVASVAPAVHAACRALARRLDAIDRRWREGGATTIHRTLAALAAAREPIEATGEAHPKTTDEERQEVATRSFGAVFAEVRIDADLGVIRVPRVVATYSVGRVLSPKTARSQLEGGIVMGVGQAIMEESLLDRAYGRYVNADMAEYHVPVNPDIGSIEVAFVEEDDTAFNSLGARGIGEIGITGVAAAIANAVFHATGRRVRDLPITLDKLL